MERKKNKTKQNKQKKWWGPNVYLTAGLSLALQKATLALQDSHFKTDGQIYARVSVMRDRTEGSGITLCQLSSSFNLIYSHHSCRGLPLIANPKSS